VQPTGRTDEPMVPRIRPDQLRMRNAGVHLREQARVQNLEFFRDREQERRQQQPANALDVAVDKLAESMAGQQPAQLPDVAQPQDPMPSLATDPVEETEMDTGATEAEKNQDDISMDDGNGVQAKDSETGKTE
ncbi:MAG: hypothetical protein GY832_47790, partial [Chloroflexi bacterium]|nr:hypothetical protein [Chloroflexota bacterium]